MYTNYIFYQRWCLLNKHDNYLETLSQKLSVHYDFVIKNVPLYSPRKRLVAEIDILAAKDGFFDVFEVKCSHRFAKAKRQLTKIQKLVNARNAFFFCGESGVIFSI